MNKPDSTKTPDLISEYYLRELSPVELNELQELLRSDPDARLQFVAHGRDEWLLHHIHHLQTQKIISFNPRKTRKRKIQAIAAAVAIVATLGTVLFSKSATISEMIASKPSATALARVSDYFVYEGQAISVVNDGHVRKLNAASKIRVGDRLVIPPGCQLSFQYLEENTEISLAGGSRVYITDNDGAKWIRLEQGRLMADVDKQAEEKPMRLVTRDAEVIVLGTTFELLAEKITRLSVSSGAVRFNSKNSEQSVVVNSGCLVDSSDGPLASVPYRMVHLVSTATKSLNAPVEPQMIAVDPVRNYNGLLSFDLKDVQGKILEAKLRMRVLGRELDIGGAGDLRLYRVQPGKNGNGQRVEVSIFSGGAGRNKDLVMDLDPSLLECGENEFLLTLDKGRNDFWICSAKGPVPPMLELKVVEE
ncbi:FecR family protein [Pontiellaceae bacterium B1224]|nr:FecR family protein [Pontiellaceae bacterium B1224]